MLIKVEKQPRLSWPLGKVIELFPGRDGLCRSVKLKTAKGIVNRSIQCLYDLEVSRAGESLGTLTPSEQKSEVSVNSGDLVNSGNRGSRNDSVGDSVGAGSMDRVTDDVQTTRYGRVSKRPEVLDL